MMIPWWEHTEKGVTGTDRQTGGQTDRKTETDRKTDSSFFKRKIHLKMLSAKCWPFYSDLNIGLFDAYSFYQGVSSTKAKKINSAHFKILEQNPASDKKKYLIHSQLHRNACRIPNESQGCAQQFFIISYQTLAQCMCQSSTPNCYMYNLHNILQNIIQFNIETICWTKKRYSIKYFRNISWNIYMSIISQNKIYPYFA